MEGDAPNADQLTAHAASGHHPFASSVACRMDGAGVYATGWPRTGPSYGVEERLSRGERVGMLGLRSRGWE